MTLLSTSHNNERQEYFLELQKLEAAATGDRKKWNVEI